MYKINKFQLNQQKINPKSHEIFYNWSKDLFLDHYNLEELLIKVNQKNEKFISELISVFPSFNSLSPATIRDLAYKKDEINFFLNFRLKGFESILTYEFPNWSPISFSDFSFDDFYFDSTMYPKDMKKKLDKFKRIEDSRKKFKAFNTPTDIISDSDSLHISDEILSHLRGTIFMSISGAQKFCPNLIEEHFGTVIDADDNYSAALNAVIFSDGSFVYTLQGLKCDFELTTYFRLDNQHLSQFERTFIIGEEDSSTEYYEGCNSVNDNISKYHAAAVELKTLKNARIIYTTLQDWSVNRVIEGGIYNLVTKRGICAEENSKIYWNQVELGSAITFKFPSCILLGKNSYGDFYSITYTDGYQQTDTGSKIIHLGEGSRSRIVSKGVQRHNSSTCVRVLVDHRTKNCITDSKCDTLLLTSKGLSLTLPIFKSSNKSQIDHEASLLSLNEDELFYLSQRAIPMSEAIILITDGFYNEVYLRLPLHVSTELRANVMTTLLKR